MALLCVYFFDVPDGWLIFFGVLLFLVLAPAFFGLKGAIETAVIAYLNRPKAVTLIRLEMDKGKLPASLDYSYHDADAYLTEIAQDPNADVAARVKATEILATLVTMRIYARVLALFFNANLERAIRERTVGAGD